jgi:hypothetical protein
LPEVIGVTWLSLGFALVLILVTMAFLFPQPPSAAGGFVRERMVARYEGFKSTAGLQEKGLQEGGTQKGSGDGGRGGQGGQGDSGQGKGTGKGSGQQQGGGQAQSVANARAERQMLKDAEVDKVIPKVNDRRMEGAQEGVQKVFDLLLKGLGLVAVLAGLVVVVVVIMSIWSGIGARAIKIRQLFPARRRAKKEKDPKTPRKRSDRFRSFADPSLAGAMNSADDLVHYLWQATLARCADAGDEYSPEQTPYEFLQTGPAALRNIEDDAQTLARWLLHAEYSGKPVPDSAMPDLMQYWARLKSISV